MHTSEHTKWYVCHGEETVHFIELNVGSAMVSGQPNIEEFDSEETAVARATALGYVFEVEDEPES